MAAVRSADDLDRGRVASLLGDLWRDRLRSRDRFLSHLADDATWRFLGWPESLLPGPRTFRGRAEMADAARLIEASVEYIENEIVDTIVEGEEAALLREVTVRHRGTGVVGTLAIHDHATLRDGRIVAYEQFLDTDAFSALLRGERQPALSRAGNSLRRSESRWPNEVWNDPEQRESRRALLRELAETRWGGNPAAAFDRCCAEDFELHLVGDTSRVPFARRHVGRAAVVELIGMIDREFELLALDIRSILVEGDRAVMHYVIDVRHRGTSLVGRSESFFHITFEGDRLKTMTEFFDTAISAALIEG